MSGRYAMTPYRPRALAFGAGAGAMANSALRYAWGNRQYAQRFARGAFNAWRRHAGFNRLRGMPAPSMPAGRAPPRRGRGGFRGVARPSQFRSHIRARGRRRRGSGFIKNKGYRKQHINARKRGLNKGFTMSNRALTNLLMPIAREIGELNMGPLLGTPNQQTHRELNMLTVLKLQHLYTKSLDLQNISTVEQPSSALQRSSYMRVVSFKDEYSIQNNTNFTANVTLIEYKYRRYCDYELTDLWGEDLQSQFQIVDAQTTPNGEALTTGMIGQHPFARGNRGVHKYFKLICSKKVLIEPGQILKYDCVWKGRAINMYDVNVTITEAGAFPQYGPFTQGMMVIVNGQMCQDTANSASGYGDINLEFLRRRLITYRANLWQQSVMKYKDADTDYSGITVGETMGMTGTEEPQTYQET